MKVLQKFRRWLSPHQFLVNNILGGKKTWLFKVLVCAKQVPDTNEIRINPETGTLIRDGVPSILNPDDANALEEALKIKDKFDDVHVTVITMGPPQAEAMLFECIAMGADEGILVSDRAVGGSDTWATSNAITAAIKKYGEFDMIFARTSGYRRRHCTGWSSDRRKIDLPQVTYVQKFEISDDRKKVTVERQLEDGYEVIEIALPCMLTAIKELNTPRYMSIQASSILKKISRFGMLQTSKLTLQL